MASMNRYQRQGTTIYAIEAPEDTALRSVNAFLVVHADGLYLIDSGWDNEACWNAFLQALQELGYAIPDLRGIILTHHHPDHAGFVHRIQKLNKAVSVHAHPLAIPYITHDKPFLIQRIRFFDTLYREMDGMPDAERQIQKFEAAYSKSEAYRIEGEIERLQEGDVILDFKVLDVPGHAPDHIMLYDAERRWAIVGDLVISHMSTNAIIEPDANGNLIPTVTQQLTSLKRLSALDVDLLFTGHGDVMPAPQAAIRSKIDRVEQKLDRIANYIRDGYTTAGSMARLYDRAVYEKQYFLVMSEVIGMLDHLERTGRVVSRRSGGIYHYALTGER